MNRKSRLLFVVQVGLGSLAGLFGLLTVFWRDWIEMIFGVDPDHGNGSFENLIVACLFAVAVVLGLWARRTWVKGHFEIAS
jgi:hypothetical protein